MPKINPAMICLTNDPCLISVIKKGIVPVSYTHLDVYKRQLYITKAPIPFVNKVNQASEKINPIAGGTIPDPNKPLSASGGAPVNAPKLSLIHI